MKRVSGNTAQIKRMNKEHVRQGLKDAGYATNADLARDTGLSISTCSNILSEMVTEGEVVVNDIVDSNGGRPAKQYCYNNGFEYKLCMFITTSDQVNTLYYVLCDAAGNEVEAKNFKKSNIDIVVLEKIISEIAERYPKIAILGIGMPGIIKGGMVIECDIEALNGIDIQKELHEKFGFFVIIGNETNYMAYGLYKNLGLDKHSTVSYITIPGGNCPGCGTVVDGIVLSGESGFAGEVRYQFLEKINVDGNVRFSGDDNIAEVLAKILVSIIIMINPKIVAITGSLMKESMLEDIIEISKKTIPEEYIPELLYREDNTKDFIRGLVELTTDRRIEQVIS